jgi:hypothetical protein
MLLKKTELESTTPEWQEAEGKDHCHGPDEPDSDSGEFI